MRARVEQGGAEQSGGDGAEDGDGAGDGEGQRVVGERGEPQRVVGNCRGLGGRSWERDGCQ